jgi:hypothetical protein
VRAQAVRLPGREVLPTRLIAGTGAGPFADAERSGVAMAAIDLGGGTLLRQVPIEPNAVAEITIGGRLVVRGQVTGGRPIAGARVSLGELDADGHLREALTDDDGRFELDTPAGDGAPLVVQADGFASTWRPIRVAADAALEQAVTLGGGVTIPVQLATKAERLELARVFVVPALAVAGELSQYPFFLQALSGGAPVDAAGSATLVGVPRRGVIRLAVVHPRALLGDASQVNAEDSLAGALVSLQLVAAHAGRIVDPDGAALAGVLLVLRPGGRPVRASAGLRFLSPDLDAAGCLLARTDADGAFVLGEPGQPGSVLSLRAEGRAGRDVPWDGLDLGTPLVLPPWTGGNLELRLLPPRAGAKWASSLNLGGCEHLVHEADQPCVVALPQAGRFDFVVTTFVGTRQKESRTFAGVHATGPVELQAPQLR